MREMKFRFWDNEKKIYTCIDGVNEDGEPFNVVSGYTGGYADYKQNIIIEQFTGLHDSNGKEIYEGDVFKYTGDQNPELTPHYFKEYKKHNWVIEWQDSHQGFVCYCKKSVVKVKNNENIRYESIDTGLSITIIGNINENPELLK